MNYFDLHCDTPYECFFKKQDFYENKLAVSGKKGEIFDDWRQTFAVWIDDRAEKPFELYKTIISDFKSKLKNKPDNLTPYFSVEGGAVIENDLENLSELKKDGVGILTLTWNGENLIAGGSKSDKGLTDFGKKVIRKMNDTGLICDLSHLNDKSFFAAVEEARYPIATHSNCRAVKNHPRNLSDEQIKLIAEKGGLVGLVFYPLFAGEDVVKGIYSNICHICDLGFEDSIAVGSDFDGAVMQKGLSDLSDLPGLFEKLEKSGLEKRLLEKVFYKNALNYTETFDKRV